MRQNLKRKYMIESLLEYIKANNLICDIEDVLDVLNYEPDDEEKEIDLDVLIKIAVQSAYENDTLEGFFLEHWEEFQEGKWLVDAKLKGGGYTTTFDLCRINSLNSYYYKVFGVGIDAECWDTSGFYEITDCEEDARVIETFKDRALEIYGGDLNAEEINNSGFVINFTFNED
ncbi:MAG: hypothetical protein QNK85_02590 [Crocinitomicaceae bacterium]